MIDDFENMNAADVQALSRDELVRGFFNLRAKLMSAKTQHQVAQGFLEFACREEAPPTH